MCTFDLDLLEESRPIHNLEYADRILEEISRSLDVLAGKTPVPRSLPDTTSRRCLRCHYGQDEAVVTYGVRLFSHRVHVHGSGVGCAACHEEQPVHGDLKDGPYCTDCHHRSAAVSCEPCHLDQRNLINAAGPFRHFQPDPMAEAGLTCRDCHPVEGTHVGRPSEATCENCHEPGYWSHLQEFQLEIQEQMGELRQALRTSQAVSGRDEAYSVLRALQRDGTRGAHNPSAARGALDSARVAL